MRFGSAKNPSEKGEIVLSPEGTIRIEPSEEFVAELARIEEVVVDRSRTFGTLIGAALIGIGALFALTGWAIGRFAGKLRQMITQPQPVKNVKLYADPEGGFHLFLRGRGPQNITLDWAPGETDAAEVAAFLAAYRHVKGIGPAGTKSKETSVGAPGGHKPPYKGNGKAGD